MIRLSIKLFVALILSILSGFSAEAANEQMLNAKISNIGNQPMEGAKLFIYDSQNVRRAADFISVLSNSEGVVQITLPTGKYWVVARYKADGKYGPLLPGDKHSGEPVEVDLSTESVEAVFVVADIKELAQKTHATAVDMTYLKGRIIDAEGKGVANAVVYANVSQVNSEYPDYISAWSTANGEYELYLPAAASYYIGTSLDFPLKKRAKPNSLLVVDEGKIDIAKDIYLEVE